MGMPENVPPFPWKAMSASSGAWAQQSLFVLLAVEHLVEIVCRDGLMPEDVVRMVSLFVIPAGSVAVKDGTAGGDMLDRMSVAPHGAVAAGHHELELALPRLAEEGDALRLAKSAQIVLELLIEALDPVWIHQPLEDLTD